MKEDNNGKRFSLVELTTLKPTACPCGTTRRAFVDDPGKFSSIHLVEIRKDSKVHYHKRHTEIYYVLDGDGIMELDGEEFPVKPGVAILIRPGCRHRAVGKMRILNMVAPAFNHKDEWFD